VKILSDTVQTGTLIQDTRARTTAEGAVRVLRTSALVGAGDNASAWFEVATAATGPRTFWVSEHDGGGGMIIADPATGQAVAGIGMARELTNPGFGEQPTGNIWLRANQVLIGTNDGTSTQNGVKIQGRSVVHGNWHDGYLYRWDYARPLSLYNLDFATGADRELILRVNSTTKKLELGTSTTAADPALTVATKDYVDGALGGARIDPNGFLYLGNVKNDNAYIVMDSKKDHERQIRFRTEGSPRWFFGATGPETGANSGSDITLSAWDDKGVFLGNKLVVERATGRVALGRSTTAADPALTVATKDYVDALAARVAALEARP
jgi:hypothetical protein